MSLGDSTLAGTVWTLQQELKLAQEGLANYEEEMQARIKLMAQKDAEIERLRALLTQAPIAKITVGEDGMVTRTGMYSPGLPPGEYDFFLMPDVNYEHT